MTSDFSPMFKKHPKHQHEILTHIEDAKLNFIPSKCFIAVKKVSYLGNILRSEGITPKPYIKLEAVETFPAPKN